MKRVIEVFGNRLAEGFRRECFPDRSLGPKSTHRASREAGAAACDCRHKWNRRDTWTMSAPNINLNRISKPQLRSGFENG